jgi:hypothetical protein
MTLENCSKKGEDYPFYDSCFRLSTRGRNLKTKRLYFVTDPKQNGTIQEIVDQKYGTFEILCRRHTYSWIADTKPDKDDSEPEVVDEHTINQGGTIRCCPYDGMRKSYCVATFNSCPWVIVVGGFFQHYNFHTLNDIPKSVILPPETQYSLACVILSDGQHFRGITFDCGNSPGVHLIFDGLHEQVKRNQIISLDDPFSKLPPFMPLWNYGMSRLMVAVPLLDQGLHLRPSPPWQRQCIHHFHPCLLMIYQLCLHMYYQQF